MTEHNGQPQPQPSRLDRIENIVASNSQAIAELAQEMRELTGNVNRVLGRSAVLDDVLLELRDNFEQHQRNFEEHQRTTNAALNQLGAILVQLTRIDPQN